MHMLRLVPFFPQGSVVVWFGDLVSPVTIHVWERDGTTFLFFCAGPSTPCDWARDMVCWDLLG